ncbi:MAG: efflux RND transporter periplasmic adaptor subunit [Planctomycetaceae bacterium]|nr:efflux RND transporter periplasmic adaptor subunit [Planctomycetaceae bacterium]
MRQLHYGGCVRWCVVLLGLSDVSTFGHEGHQPLPTKGVQIDLQSGHLTLSRAAREVLDVQTVEVEMRNVATSVRAYATAVAPWTQRAYVTSRLSGRIVALRVRPGDVVVAGQILAELDSLDLQTLRLDYQKTLNELDLSTKILESLEPAAKAGSIPGQRLFEAETTQRQNQNALAVLRAKAAGLGVAETDLSTPVTGDSLPLRLSLASPLGGVVVHADVAVGKFVEPTEHLFEIVETARAWVKMGVLEQDLHRVQEGQTVRLAFHGLPGQRFETKVDKLGLWLDPQTHQGTAWAEIVNTATTPRLLPGMNGQAEFVLPGRLQSLSVPTTALFSDGAERYVFVEETSTKASSEYRKKPVVIGRQTREFAEVVSGDLYPGDRVVTRGGHELSSLFFLGVLRLSPETAKSLGLQVEAVSERSVERILRLEGAIDVPPQRRTVASSQLPGTLRELHVDRGQSVKAGDILAEVASLELQDVQLDFLQAHLDGTLWRDTLARRRGAGDALPRRTVLETESRVKAFEAQFANLRQKLLTLGLTSEQISGVANTQQVIGALPIRAPIDGVVVRFDRVLGQVVRADEPLFEIHDLAQVWVEAFVGERDSAQVQVGQTARIQLVAHPDFEAEGTVARIGPVVGTDSRTLAAWIEFRDLPAVPLQHNMLARVTLTTERPSPTLAVPLGAVVRDGLRSFVFVQKPDGTFDRRRVELSRADDRFVEIRTGLARGEMVATSGVPQLQTAYSALR